MTFGVSRLLSGTLLKGMASSFTLEMPPYRRPQIGKVLTRSLFDRTLVVLGRAAAVAAPAGLLLWALQAVCLPDGVSLLTGLSRSLDGLGRLMGLDGILLTAFLLGFPANEIVLPIALMLYLSQGSLTELGSAMELPNHPDGAGVELADRRVYAVVHAVSLALLHDTAHHPQGNGKPSLDSAGVSAAHAGGPAGLHSAGAARAAGKLCCSENAGLLCGFSPQGTRAFWMYGLK